MARGIRTILSSIMREASAAWLKMVRKVFSHIVIPVEPKDLSQDDVIIALVGPTGAGKSKFISKATGTDVGVGDSLNPCTTEVRSFRSQYMERSDLDVVFVDTPGFDDTCRSDQEIFGMIIDWLENTYKRGVKLSGILYFHRISTNRMSGTPLKNLDMFERLCGKNGLQKVMFITTMWDHPGLNNKDAIRCETELKEKYWKGMIEAGSKVARYECTWDSAWDIIDHFLEQANERYAEQLQMEMAKMKEHVPETSHGIQLYTELEALLEKQQEVLKKIRAAIKRHKDESTLTTLRTAYEYFRAQLQSIVADIQQLKIPIGIRIRRRFETQLGS